MKIVIQVAAKDSAKAWGVLVRHSPGTATCRTEHLSSPRKQCGLCVKPGSNSRRFPGTRSLRPPAETSTVKEFDVFVPVTYNDGSPVGNRLIESVGERLLERFDGMTFFPQENEAVGS